MGQTWDLETAKADDFEELTSFLDRAFGLPAGFFGVQLGHIYSPQDMPRNLIIRRAGAIAAVCGLFPMIFRIEDVALSALGIGGVSADPEMRGQGMMTRLLEAAQEELREAKCDISWLGGNRERYARYGWEHAGSKLWSRLYRKSAWTEQADGAVVEPSLFLDDIQTIFNAMPLRTERSQEAFQRQLARPGWTWWMTDGAYAVQREETPTDVVELAGSAPGAERLLRAILDTEQKPLNVQTPNDLHPVTRAVQRLSSSSHMGQIGSLKIVDLVSTLTKLIPLMERRLSPLEASTAFNLVMLDPLPSNPGFVQIVHVAIEGGCVEIQPGTGRGPTLTLDRRDMASLIFGRWGEEFPLPPIFDVLRHLLPAPLHVYELDQV